MSVSGEFRSFLVKMGLGFEKTESSDPVILGKITVIGHLSEKGSVMVCSSDLVL